MTSTTNFVHLHVHSHYTLLGGTASVAELAARAAAEGLSHLALTDTNALYGAVAFDRACRAAGVQPILGMTVTVAAAGRARWRRGATPGRLVLLATGPAGYRSLCRLSSLLQAHPDREARLARGLSWDDLEAHREGLICLSGGRRAGSSACCGPATRHAADRYAGRLADLYGDGAYLSLELHRPEDRACADKLVRLGQRLGLRPVAVQPVYCLAPEDAARLRLLAAIDHNCPWTQVPPDGAARRRRPRRRPALAAPRRDRRRALPPSPSALARSSEIAEPLRPGPARWPSPSGPP